MLSPNNICNVENKEDEKEFLMKPLNILGISYYLKFKEMAQELN